MHRCALHRGDRAPDRTETPRTAGGNRDSVLGCNTENPPPATAREAGSLRVLQQVLDAITDKLDDELKEKVQSKGFPISTLDRILKYPYAREFLGLSTEGGAPQRVLEEKETLKGLTRSCGILSRACRSARFTAAR